MMTRREDGSEPTGGRLATGASQKTATIDDKPLVVNYSSSR
jgi:hypothetical protein